MHFTPDYYVTDSTELKLLSYEGINYICSKT